MGGRHKSAEISPEALHDLLTEFVTKPTFIDYPTDRKAKVNPKLILKSAEMWRAIREACNEQISLRDSVITATLLKIYEEKKDTTSFGKLKPAAVPAWASTCSKRMRAQARAISQTTLKAPNKIWLAQLWETELEHDAEVEEEKEEEEEIETDNEEEEEEEEATENSEIEGEENPVAAESEGKADQPSAASGLATVKDCSNAINLHIHLALPSPPSPSHPPLPIS
jgi:hypothetical protein